jgi:HAD superfamily hydrolase (TIGR01509 family)
VIEAVVFDLDGVLIDSEHVWDEVRRQLAEERGGTWHDDASRDMMGMSSLEWSRYMRDRVGLQEEPAEISGEVVRRLEERYRTKLPLIAGAEQAVAQLAEHWPLGLASSSNRELIDLVLESSGLGRFFRASVSSEEVSRGKPAPDVFLEAARRLSADPARCAAVEDSENGIRAAKAAGMHTIAIPNPQYPPDEDALAEADVVLAAIEDLSPAVVEPEAP